MWDSNIDIYMISVILLTHNQGIIYTGSLALIKDCLKTENSQETGDDVILTKLINTSEYQYI